MVVVVVVVLLAQHHVLLVGEAGRALMLGRAIDHKRLRVSASVDRSAARVDRKYVRGASLRVDGKPAVVVREGDVADFGGRVAPVQRVHVFDHSARALERARVDLKLNRNGA